MSDYMESMEKYSPTADKATGQRMGEVLIKQVNSVPEATSTEKDYIYSEEPSVSAIPQYMVPKIITVRRYRLNK